MAKDVEFVAVKVLDDQGRARLSDVIAALEYVVEHKELRPKELMVVNLSLGTPRVSQLFNSAIKTAIDAGIPVVVAAGNGNKDACTWSPASAAGVISVGALTIEK